MIGLYGWAMHIYGNSITLTPFNTTMAFLLACSLQSPLNICSADVATHASAIAVLQHYLAFCTLEEVPFWFLE